MKTIKKVPVTALYLDAIPKNEEQADGIIYVSREYETAVHRCLCGCGLPTITPLHEGEWTLIDKEGKITMTPSLYNRQYPCKSHYIITNGIANFI